MDFLEDIFERKSRHGDKHYHDVHSHGDHNRYRDDHYDHDPDHHGLENLRPLISKILHNRALLFGLAIGACLLLVIGVALLFAFLPLITHSIEYVNQHGIKGVFDLLMPILERVWKGQE